MSNFIERRSRFKLPTRHSSVDGGVWIWLMILILVAGAAGGGLYFLDKTQFESGAKLSAEAKTKLQAGNHEEARKAATAALEQLTGVSVWTPFNGQSVGPERDASEVWLRATLQLTKDQNPELSNLCLNQLIAMGVKDAEILSTQLQQRNAAQLFHEAEIKMSEKQLERFWEMVENGKEFTDDKLKLLNLDQTVAKGLARHKITTRRNSAISKLKGIVSEDSKSSPRSEINSISIELSKPFPENSVSVFAGFESQLGDLQNRSSEAALIATSLLAIVDAELQLKSWHQRISSEAKFLGSLSKDSKFSGFLQPSLSSVKTPEFQKLTPALELRIKSLKDSISQLQSLAKAFENMSLVFKETGVLVFLDQRETTRAEFKRFLESGKGYQLPGRKYWTDKGWEKKESKNWQRPLNWETLDKAENSNWPITGLSFHEAEAFARYLGKRLPKFSEWLAAYGTKPYPWGSNWEAERANFRTSYTEAGELRGVQSGSQNFGNFTDLLGNAAEFTTLEKDGKPSYILAGGSFLKIADKPTIESLGKADRQKVLQQQVSSFLVEQRRDAGLRLAKVLDWDEIKGIPIGR